MIKKTRSCGLVVFLLFGVFIFFSTQVAITAVAGSTGSTGSQAGPLSRAHSGLEGAADCTRCHIAEGKISPGLCLDCHRDLADRIAAKRGFHRDKPKGCGGCHTEHQGGKIPLVKLDVPSFDHGDTGYLLSGAHGRVDACSKCHNSRTAPTGKKYTSYFIKDKHCTTCHREPHRGVYPRCVQCHTTRDWSVDIW